MFCPIVLPAHIARPPPPLRGALGRFSGYMGGGVYPPPLRGGLYGLPTPLRVRAMAGRNRNNSLPLGNWYLLTPGQMLKYLESMEVV